MRALLPLCLFPILSTAPAFGWGCEGHQIVALIARAHLTPAAAAAVDQLLRESPIDPALRRFCRDRPDDPMADAATWADDIKYTEKTDLWHYVDIPLTVTSRTSLAPWCPPIGPAPPGEKTSRPGCVTSALEYELAILRDKSRSAADRATALRYVIHFAGDIQQPLHDSNNNDRGGNCTSMQFFAEDRPTNLHSIWDYKLIEHKLTLDKLTQPDYARQLDRQFASQAAPAAASGPVDWAWEGHQLALAVTYGDLSPSIPVEKTAAPLPTPDAVCDAETGKITAIHIAIGEKYFNQAMPVIGEQLAKGGYRLAALLNQSF